MNIFKKLETMQNLTANESQIVSFLLTHPQQFLSMDINEIAKTCFVSQTTVYRLCSKLELSGLSDLKIQLSGSIDRYLNEHTELDFNFPVKEHQNTKEVLYHIKEDYEQTIASTFDLFDIRQLEKAASLLHKASCIDIYTSAGNLFFAQNFKFQMKEIGVSVQVPIEEYDQRLHAASSDETHVAILITFGGRGILVDALSEILTLNHTPILLISSQEYQKQASYADCYLSICANEDHYHKLSSYSTRLSLLYILDILYTCYFEKNYDAFMEKKFSYYHKIISSNHKK